MRQNFEIGNVRIYYYEIIKICVQVTITPYIMWSLVGLSGNTGNMYINLLTLSAPNLPLSFSSSISHELLPQFLTCSGWRWFEVGRKVKKIAHVSVNSFMKIFILKPMVVGQLSVFSGMLQNIFVWVHMLFFLLVMHDFLKYSISQVYSALIILFWIGGQTGFCKSGARRNSHFIF